MWLICLCFMCFIVYSWGNPPAVSECQSDQFQCVNGECLSLLKRCNGLYDCSDNSDELECDMQGCHEPNWFQCSDGSNGPCISSDLVCDGYDNCPTGVDELHCNNTEYKGRKKCSRYEFKCSSGRQCIPRHFMCDGKEDCQDGSDESKGCTEAEANCRGYLCENKRCLESKSWLCDNVDDCGDGSDERNCTELCTHENKKFLCEDGLTCLRLEKACDSQIDCMDGSDEKFDCSKNTNCSTIKCPIAARCQILPESEAKCLCPDGFRHSTEANACVDINECKEQYDVCSQKCTNRPGSFRCSCGKGYILNSDNRSCESIMPHAILFYTTEVTVMGMNLYSQRVFTFAKNLSKAVGISSDNQHIYWTDIQRGSESIVRVSPDGKEMETLLTSGLDLPEDLSVDWLTGNIYFTDTGMGHIAVCNKDARYCTALITKRVHQPRGIAVWPEKGQMFWTDWGARPMIARAAMDGSNSMAIVNESIRWPNGIALDTYNNRIYWVDAKHATIESIRPDGSDRRIVLDGVPKHPYGLALFGDVLYWSDWGTNSIHSCHKFNGKDHKILIKDDTIFSLHIYQPIQQKAKFHACINATCSHLCLLKENNQFTCACPLNMQLAKDRLNCITIPKRQRLLLGFKSYILEIEPITFERNNIFSTYVTRFHVDRMAYNTVNETIFIADNLKDIIGEYDFRNDHFRILIRHNVGNVTDLAFDHLAYNLYWCDGDKQTIEIFSIQNRRRGIISVFYGHQMPLAIAIIPNDGILFVALKSLYSSHIDQMAMSGKQQTTHVFEDELGDNDIRFAVDTIYNTLYWSDVDSRRISYSDYKAKLKTKVFRSRLNAPNSLAILGENLFWSDVGSSTIHWTNRNGRESIKSFDITLDQNIYAIDPMKFTNIALISNALPKLTDHPCQHRNGGCSHICITVDKFRNSCLCPPGLTFKDNNNQTCIQMMDCGFRCDTGQCLTLSHRCDGHRDCPDNSDETNCPSGKINKPLCHLDEFTCHNRVQCVAWKHRCDGYSNCDDGSDEQQCETFDKSIEECPSNRFMCNNGKCVDLSITCDGYNDCGDGSDESNCPLLNYQSLCKSDMFQCASGTCIAKSWECDGKIDCTDGSDEHKNCGELECPSDTFRCFLGQCIDKRLVCNGYNDCGDTSDEINCNLEDAIIHSIPCKADRMESILHCSSDASICLESSARCNGIKECPLGEDEANCNDACAPAEFTCKADKECLPPEFRCDHDKDCSDGSDEENCEYNIPRNQTKSYRLHEQACGHKMYDCRNGRCIAESRVCDGLNDCENGLDEGGLCKTACKSPNGTKFCADKCQATPAGAVCSCLQGYRLDVDLRSCIDIDECDEYEPCSQICHNLPGSYYCSCYPEFMLHNDKTTCKSINNTKYLLLSTLNQVRNVTEEPLSMRIAWSANDSKIISFDINVHLHLAYYITDSENTLYRINMSSGLVEQNLTVMQPMKVVVDWITDNIYVLSRSQTYEILVCSFAINMCTTVIRAVPNSTIKTLTVDAYNGRVFFVVIYSEAYGQHSSAIGTSNLDGTKRHFIYTKEHSYITALACDPYKKILYYIDLHEAIVYGLNYAKDDDAKPYIVMRSSSALIYPIDINWYENELFVINWAVKGVTHCLLYGNHICKFISLNILNMENIVIDGITRQPLKPNPCLISKCRDMCLQSEKGYICKCDDSIVSERESCSTETNPSASLAKGTHVSKILIILFVVLVFLILAGYVFKYYHSRWTFPLFNRHLHFQNPLVAFHRNNDRGSFGKHLLPETKTDTAATIDMDRPRLYFHPTAQRLHSNPKTFSRQHSTLLFNP